MSVKKLESRLTELRKQQDASPNDGSIRHQIHTLESAINSASILKTAQDQLTTATATEAACKDALAQSATVVQRMEALLAHEQDAFEQATQLAGQAMLQAVKEGKDPAAARPSNGGVEVAKTALAAARAEHARAEQATTEATAERQSAEQAMLVAECNCTLLALLLAEEKYREALTAHHLTHWAAHRGQFKPTDVQSDAWYAARAVLWAD